jgi:hypothetical protein
MSANGATEQRSSFQRWVASLKRESQPGGTSTVPAVPGVREKRDDDATRVHRVPKDILMRLQARAAASASESLHAERTAVFRAPPELLERAKGMRAVDERVDPATAAEEDLTQPLSVLGANAAPSPTDESSAILDFQDSTEATSGISQRPPGLAPRAHAGTENVIAAAVPSEGPEPGSSQSFSNDDSADWSPDDSADWSPDDSADWSPGAPSADEALSADADVDELVASAESLVEQEPQGLVDSSDRLSEPPQFRRRLGPTLVVVTWLLLAASALVFFAQR